MIWWEFNQDNGDGTTSAQRFRTKEEADKARAWAEEQPYYIGDGDGAPVTKVDTDDKWFFDTLKSFTNGEIE